MTNKEWLSSDNIQDKKNFICAVLRYVQEAEVTEREYPLDDEARHGLWLILEGLVGAVQAIPTPTTGRAGDVPPDGRVSSMRSA